MSDGSSSFQTRLFKVEDLGPNVGHDERSLLKLPFTTIRKTKANSIEERWTQVVDGKKRDFFKIVAATEQYGMPDQKAEDVFIALLYLSARMDPHPFASNVIRIAPAELVRMMQWDDSGRSYERLRTALHQLTSLTVYTNAFFSSQSDSFEETQFSLIDRWKIGVDEDNEWSGAVTSKPLTIYWGEGILELFEQGRYKALDVDRYYSLSSPVARRLYRWVDEALYPNGYIEVDVKHLAYVRLAISRSRKYVSQIMQSMKRGLEELEERDICRWDLRESKTPSGKKLCFWRIDQEEKAKTRSLEDRLSTLRQHEREQLLDAARSRLDRFQREQAQGKSLDEMPHGVRENLLTEIRALLDQESS